MTPGWQTLVALLLVALAALLLARTALVKKKPGAHHGGIGCPMLSTEMKDLHARLARVKRTPPPET